nr:NAD(P)H-binding protein [Halobellus rarus]
MAASFRRRPILRASESFEPDGRSGGRARRRLGTPPGEAADDTLSAGVQTLVEAMADIGIERFVGVAAAGVLDAPGGGLRLDAVGFPPFLRGVAKQHRAVYETLTESSVQWTLVCPPDIPDGDATGQARVETDRLPDGGTQVTTCDVAAS